MFRSRWQQQDVWSKPWLPGRLSHFYEFGMAARLQCAPEGAPEISRLRKPPDSPPNKTRNPAS